MAAGRGSLPCLPTVRRPDEEVCPVCRMHYLVLDLTIIQNDSSKKIVFFYGGENRTDDKLHFFIMYYFAVIPIRFNIQYFSMTRPDPAGIQCQ